MRGNQILDKMLCLCLLHTFIKWHLLVIFMEKSKTLHYINLAFIPRDCDVAPKQNPRLAPSQSHAISFSK